MVFFSLLAQLPNFTTKSLLIYLNTKGDTTKVPVPIRIFSSEHVELCVFYVLF